MCVQLIYDKISWFSATCLLVHETQDALNNLADSGTARSESELQSHGATLTGEILDDLPIIKFTYHPIPTAGVATTTYLFMSIERSTAARRREGTLATIRAYAALYRKITLAQIYDKH